MAGNLDQLARIAQNALADGYEDQALPKLAAFLDINPGSARILHWQALLLRSLDQRGQAIQALRAAQKIEPYNASVAHSLAQTAQEAGHPSTDLFRSAARLNPENPEILLGLTSSRFADGDGEAALFDLDAMLQANPGWSAGHRQYAQLSAMLGRADTALTTVNRALIAHPAAGALHLLVIELLLDAEQPAAALAATVQAIQQLGEAPALLLCRAVALDELGEHVTAAGFFEQLGLAKDIGHAVRRLRHFLRVGQIDRAAYEMEIWLADVAASLIWPYAAPIWRASGDPRAEWLDQQSGLVSIVDLPQDAINLTGLAELLRSLHGKSGRFLNQSVRHGTQTDGPLLAREDPLIVDLREKLRSLVSAHAAGFPPLTPNHPMAGRKKNWRPRFAGSWSVRLDGDGFHESHHHPQGWISSAFYVSVPEGLAGNEGQLALGSIPENLGLKLEPRLVIKPKPGRLALFPSTMWHGTLPFTKGERMTIAFDIARP
jgi:Flp pilus assembly protein TadD